MQEALGYYPFLPDRGAYLEAACPACHDAHGQDKCTCCTGYDPADSEPIFYDSCSDTPTHCTHCEALIPHRLTRDGFTYVAEALIIGTGREEILNLWRKEYGGVALDVALKEAQQ